jgi:flagellar hook protein FlgE
MSLSSALFTGISGLSTLGNSMTVIGDNIANVNTTGFKSSRVTFQDVLSQTVAVSPAGYAQVGRGTSLADISSTFAQGSFESTDSPTDLAIGGGGFFVVRDPSNQDNEYYTRSGEFLFDKDGNFVNPAGYIVQGWALDQDTGQNQGSITDIVLQSFTLPPQETDHIRAITNLDSDATSRSSSLSNAWDGTLATPIGSDSYEYQSTLKVYDSLGTTHDITIYYDKISGSDWEYIITCNPAEDNRTGFSGTASAGLLARGQITFSESSGTITDLTLEDLTATGHQQNISNIVTAGGVTGHNETVTINDYGAVTLDSVGFQLEWDGAGWSIINSPNYPGAVIFGLATDPTAVDIDLDGSGDADISVRFGTAVTDTGVAPTDTLTFDITGSANWTADSVNRNGYFEFDPDFLGGTSTSMSIEFDIGTRWDGSAFVPDSLSTTQFAGASTTTFQASDGYGAGDLQSVTVEVDGTLMGQYSNGRAIPLFRIALAKFQNTQGLYKVGGNLFRETRLSGDAITGQPGTNGLGNISPNSLEQSNVDIATEFVKMITTQRGFQANSKIITVTDQMLAELINLKR